MFWIAVGKWHWRWTSLNLASFNNTQYLFSKRLDSILTAATCSTRPVHVSPERGRRPQLSLKFLGTQEIHQGVFIFAWPWWLRNTGSVRLDLGLVSPLKRYPFVRAPGVNVSTLTMSLGHHSSAISLFLGCQHNTAQWIW